MCGTPPEEKAELRRGKLKKFLPFLWKREKTGALW